MKTVFITNSPILDAGRLEENLSRVVGESLEEFERLVKDRQVQGQQTGRVSMVRINGGVIRHIASAIGETPAPVTGALVRSTESEQFSATRGEVRVTRFYGAILQNKLRRDVTTGAEEIYAPRFQEKIARAVEDLL